MAKKKKDRKLIGVRVEMKILPTLERYCFDNERTVQFVVNEALKQFLGVK